MTILYPAAMEERANNLGTLNGLKLVLVSLVSGPPSAANLEVQFYNDNDLAAILNDINANAVPPATIFKIHGGRRVPAGDAIGEVQATAVAAGLTPDTLMLTVEPIGDYSTYTLEAIHAAIDPFFSRIPFKFRPGCFTNDCAPDWAPGSPLEPAPTIDYLAKDYDSFRHTLITAMMQRVPGWKATSEADLDQVLIDLFSAIGDELSDYQDRVMNEAYLVSCRNRVSLARHARLMDYHIHQGNQASSWLALKISAPGLFTLAPKFTVWTGEPRKQKDAIVFATRREWPLHPLLNQMRLYTWDGAAPALAAGDTQADLLLDTPGKSAVETVRDLIRDGTIMQLAVQEWKNPATGHEAGRNPEKRQLLQLLNTGDHVPVADRDPLTNTWFVRVFWREQDKLKFNYTFTSFCPTGTVDDISLFHGNLARIHHGDWAKTHFYEPGVALATDTPEEKHRYFIRPARYEQTYGALCRLPREHIPLAYQPTASGGEDPPVSTLWVENPPAPSGDGSMFEAHVAVELPGPITEIWDEVISLVHSDDSSENGDHFVVETDEQRRSVLRFGDGTNGRLLPDHAIVHCAYQIGGGAIGNIGFDQLKFFDTATTPEVTECWNPFDIVDGRDPEPTEKIVRRAPDAYRARQLRAVTLLDYIKRAEELPAVSRAVANYAWTGSWRTVRVAIDPVGTTTLDDDGRRRIEQYLDAVRLIGEDLEIRPPIFVPLAIEVALCIDPEFWREDVRFVLEQEFSEGYTPDGRLGFFHPDCWTFGQPLHASEIAGRVHQVAGIEHIISIALKRWNEPAPTTSDIVEMRFNEILRVRNDPDSMEDGYIRFDLKGGRQ
jgi:Baseplate J-like protein